MTDKMPSERKLFRLLRRMQKAVEEMDTLQSELSVYAVGLRGITIPKDIRADMGECPHGCGRLLLACDYASHVTTGCRELSPRRIKWRKAEAAKAQSFAK